MNTSTFPSDAWLPIAEFRNIRPVTSSGQNDSFAAIYIRNDSLIDLLIGEGDIVIYKQTQQAREGNLIVAQTPKGLTCRCLKKRDANVVILQAANPFILDEVYTPADVKILGVVKRIERDFA